RRGGLRGRPGHGGLGRGFLSAAARVAGLWHPAPHSAGRAPAASARRKPPAPAIEPRTPGPMRIDLISLFPEFVAQCAAFGVVGRARERGLLSVHGWNPRDYPEGNHRRADDRPSGRGPGMLRMIAPRRAAIRAARSADTRPPRSTYPR